MDLSCFGQTNQALDDSVDASEANVEEDEEGEPQLVYQSNNTAIYRVHDKGIKVIVSPNPSEEQILQLVHELNISKFLPAGARKRRVLDVKGFKGDPAIYFQWTRGKTIAEWMRKARRRRETDVDMTVRLRAAIAIVETLHEFHDGGVVYNNLTPKNVVLDTFEGSYVATFIDLSDAIIYYNRDQGFAAKAAETDLRCLGALLAELFCGDDANGISEQQKAIAASVLAGGREEKSSSSTQHYALGAGSLADDYATDEERKEEPCTRSKRGKMQQSSQQLGEGLPMYLNTLISTLLLPELEEGVGGVAAAAGAAVGASAFQIRYTSAKDVLLDLRVVEKNPSVYLKPLVMDEHLARGRLQLPGDCFYGRQSEKAMLLHALSSIMMLGGQPMLCAISGSPGTGKTSLVNQIKQPLEDASGYLVSGKFDVRTRADSVIFSALDSFYLEIMKEGNEDVHREIRCRILNNVGSGCRLMMASIPSLQAFLFEHGHSRGGEGVEDAYGPTAPTERWKYLLCKLVASSSSKEHPLCFFLDDLQWADETSLDVIRMMATDPDLKYCLFVCVYRDNESSATKRLKKLLHGMQELGVSLMSIKVGQLEKDCINALLSETLCLPPRICKPLATLIHNKTGGIALWVLDFLRSLNEEGLLWFNFSSRRWEYDARGIEEKEISEDVVEHMSARMTRLPHGMQSGLKLAACLGSKFDLACLTKGVPNNEVEINEFVRFAVEGGYFREISEGKLMWAHDQIQQAAYELISDAKRESFHLLLGSRMYLRTTPEELDNSDYLFTIVGNMNIGARLIKSQEQKLEVARLNLRAGEVASATSSFHSAANYLMLGVTLLPDNSWDEDYDMTLRLYNSAVESLYVTGDFDTLSTIIQVPLFRARSFDDKIHTYHILVRFLVASGQNLEGISKCVSVLAQLGHPIPEHVDNNVYTEEVLIVRESLKNLSENDLFSLPLMTDMRKVACVQFMSHAVNAAYSCAPLLAPVLVFRMVRLSLEHGVCKDSSFAFGLYGAWLVSAINSDFEGGYRMGRLAVNLMNRLEAKEFLPRVYTSVYAFINIWKEPFQAGLPKHLEGYEVGSLGGDMEFAISNLWQYSTCALNNCGEELNMLDQNIRLYIRRAMQRSQMMSAKSLVVLHEQTLILKGSAESSYSTFLDSSEDAVYHDSLSAGEIGLCRYILFKRKFVAFFYGDMKAAAESFEMGNEYPLGPNGRLCHITLGTVIDGLMAFFFARKHREDEIRWWNIAESVMDLTRQWANNSEWNFINKLYLLEAECHFYKGEERQALDKYMQSIKAAHDHHFIHEEGLAYDLAARFHLHYARNGEALVCFTQAKKCYKSWGAHGLVNHIERTILQLI